MYLLYSSSLKINKYINKSINKDKKNSKQNICVNTLLMLAVAGCEQLVSGVPFRASDRRCSGRV
jgi:hypothetical protein